MVLEKGSVLKVLPFFELGLKDHGESMSFRNRSGPVFIDSQIGIKGWFFMFFECFRELLVLYHKLIN